MKKYVFSILLVLFCSLVICQNNKKILLYDYEIAPKPTDAALMYEYFLTIHPEPFYIWCEPRVWQQLGDTAYYVVSENGNKDTIYVYNYQSFETKKIPLTQTNAVGIDAVYLHSLDSVFLFYDRYYVLRKREKTGHQADMVLLDGNGNVKGEYFFDNIPLFLEDATDRDKHIWTIGYDIIGNRMIGDEMLLTFAACPHYSSEDYADFNPKIAAMYNLKTNHIRMLNIRYPSSCFGKKYEGHKADYWVTFGKNNDIFIGFRFTHEIYRYDLKKDTMEFWDSKYDNAFINTDSASMKPNDNHMTLRFDNPQWNEQDQCYMRLVSIVSYKDYRPWQEILQIMDSKFHHLGYVIAKKDYHSVPRMVGNVANVKSNIDKQRHSVKFFKTAKKVSMSDWENTYLQKRDLPKFTDSLHTISAYFDSLNIPKRKSLILIINTKYPCSSCFNYLLSTMKEHEKEYEENDIYYIIYDPNDGAFAASLLKEHGMENAKNIRVDTYLLEKLFLSSGYPDAFFKWDSNQFRLVDYLREGEKSGHMALNFELLQPYFTQAAKEQIEWKQANK
ncbi:MAG: hypothetical protein K6F29_00775 [Bacteroidales bacterium]|nr:hypothetical protein [Bacteroidales bacterium]